MCSSTPQQHEAGRRRLLLGDDDTADPAAPAAAAMEPPNLDVSLVVGGGDFSEQGPRIYLGSQAATQVSMY